MVESRQFNQTEDKAVRTNICSPKNFKDLAHTVFKKRDHGLTLAIILIMITSAIVRFISHADVSVFYLSLRKTLNWDMEKYTLYKTVRDLLRIIVTIAGITLLHKKMKIREAPLILVSAALTFASMLLQAWATADWHIYLENQVSNIIGTNSLSSSSRSNKKFRRDLSTTNTILVVEDGYARRNW
ncbi:MFS transporter [Holotrichia oblita]|uniref:MFS transporter n=1 Tax=Holotrichia oblita TaxID=644536 RepID=A0ACB9SN07_HOLOL|nr:MFS transporter [Holotrichia oblita]